MRRILLICLVLALWRSATGQAQEATGEWWTPGFHARIRIEPCDKALCGRIVWAWDDRPAGIADGAPLTGQIVISAMLPQGDSLWSGGRLYNPEDGRAYVGTMRLKGPNNLELRGCVLIFCKTQVWRRVEPDVCRPQLTANRQTYKQMVAVE